MSNDMVPQTAVHGGSGWVATALTRSECQIGTVLLRYHVVRCLLQYTTRYDLLTDTGQMVHYSVSHHK